MYVYIYIHTYIHIDTYTVYVCVCVCVIYKCGREPHKKSWRAADKAQMKPNILDNAGNNRILRSADDHFFRSFPVHYSPVIVPCTLYRLKFCRPCHRNSYSAYLNFCVWCLEICNVQNQFAVCEIHQVMVNT